MDKVTWHKTALLPHMDGSTVFAGWRQCAPLESKRLCAEAAQVNQLVWIGPVWILVMELWAGLELVDMFCYLGERLSEDGDADAAEEATVCV